MAELTSRFGPEVAKKIAKKQIWIGMTKEMARESWGPPKDINRTVTAEAIHEQWIYSKAHLYSTTAP